MSETNFHLHAMLQTSLYSEETGFVAYYNNEGKRQAVRELAAYLL